MQSSDHRVQMRQLLGQQEALVPHVARERALELAELVPQLTPGQIGERRRLGRAADERIQHLAPRDAKDVTRDVAQLDASALERLLDPIALGSAFAVR